MKKNKGEGTALTAAFVSTGPGTLVLTGKGLVKQRPAPVSGSERVAARIVNAAGTLKLKVRPKGKKKRKLDRTGKVKVQSKHAPPTGGEPNTQAKQARLVKRL